MKGVLLVPERDKLFENLTVEENLDVCTPLAGTKLSRKDLLERVYTYFPVLGNLKSRLGGYLSGGGVTDPNRYIP